jgi:hypothetical protein
MQRRLGVDRFAVDVERGETCRGALGVAEQGGERVGDRADERFAVSIEEDVRALVGPGVDDREGQAHVQEHPRREVSRRSFGRALWITAATGN